MSGEKSESEPEERPETLPSADLARAESEYEAFVETNLLRNFAGHFIHGMLGMTGFRIFNSPTFLPAYLHIITASMPGSDFLVGLGQSLQQCGSAISPVVGAGIVEHRKRVLPVSMVVGTLMRVQIAAIALVAWFLHGPPLVVAVMFFLALLGLFSGAQGVAFQLLLAKVIPIRVRGRLQALRNLAGGQVAAGVAYLAGRYLIGDNFLGNGYAATFALSAILTTLGLSLLAILMREPDLPRVRAKSRVLQRIQEFPELLKADRGYMFFVIALAFAAAGRIALPFYILFARTIMPLTGANIGLLSLVLFEGDSLSNMLWGLLGDRWGFRTSFVAALVVWLASTVVLLTAGQPAMVLVAFFGLGAAQSGLMMSSQTMVLEFGARHDMPMRLGLSQTVQGVVNTVGPLMGGAIALSVGYRPLFMLSMAFEAIALVLLVTLVDEPRLRRASA